MPTSEYVCNLDRATVMDTYINRERSPVEAALCNIGGIMTGDNAELVLIWRQRGCVSMYQWCQEYKDDAMLVFRMSAGVARQH